MVTITNPILLSVHPVVSCADPGKVEHSRRVLSGPHFTVGSTIQYICNKGFTLSGNSLLTCFNRGSSGPRWNQKLPRCLRTYKFKCFLRPTQLYRKLHLDHETPQFHLVVTASCLSREYNLSATFPCVRLSGLSESVHYLYVHPHLCNSLSSWSRRALTFTHTSCSEPAQLRLCVTSLVVSSFIQFVTFEPTDEPVPFSDTL